MGKSKEASRFSYIQASFLILVFKLPSRGKEMIIMAAARTKVTG